MSKPETSFIAGVHKYLPPSLHHEKMHNAYRGGTADVWYDGKRDLWVEYKFLVVPKRPDTLIYLTAGKAPMLSALQQKWLSDREANGRGVWVIVGHAKGGVIMPQRQEWSAPWTTSKFLEYSRSRKELAEAIWSFTESTP